MRSVRPVHGMPAAGTAFWEKATDPPAVVVDEDGHPRCVVLHAPLGLSRHIDLQMHTIPNAQHPSLPASQLACCCPSHSGRAEPAPDWQQLRPRCRAPCAPRPHTCTPMILTRHPVSSCGTRQAAAVSGPLHTAQEEAAPCISTPHPGCSQSHQRIPHWPQLRSPANGRQQREGAANPRVPGESCTLHQHPQLLADPPKRCSCPLFKPPSPLLSP